MKSTTRLLKQLQHKAKLAAMYQQPRPIATTTTNLQAPLLVSASRPAILRLPLQSHHSPAPPSIASMSTTTSNTSIRDPNLDAIFDLKRAVRSKVRKELKAMTPTQRSEQDAAIQDIVLESLWFKSTDRLCAYVSCSSLREVDTSKILSEILRDREEEGLAQSRKKLYVPRVEDKNSYMKMLNISSTADLIANSMGILEPSTIDSNGNQREDVLEASEPVDLILLPGLAFDRCGRRLGRSGGYYDMFLKRYQERSTEHKWKQPLLVALAYNLQILEDGAIPVTPFDIPVDALVSPSGIIPISPAAKERM